MKAIIMAGGEGKRLKPITGSTPKPLVPLCGRPVMEHIILLLRRHGITDICAALKYRPGDIKTTSAAEKSSACALNTGSSKPRSARQAA